MSNPNSQVTPGGLNSTISNNGILSINESIENENVSSLDVAKILIQFAESIHMESGHFDCALINKIKVNDNTIKEFNNMLDDGIYSD